MTQINIFFNIDMIILGVLFNFEKVKVCFLILLKIKVAF